jgi:hypothetical protein
MKVLEDIMQTELPSKKIEQAKLLYKLCEFKQEKIKGGHPGRHRRWYSDEDLAYQDNVYNSLRNLKTYNVK